MTYLAQPVLSRVYLELFGPAMFIRSVFSLPDSEQEHFNAIKALFMKYLADTEHKCLKLCANVYDQERNYYMSYLPKVEENKFKIENTKKRILEELNKIEITNKGSPKHASQDLICYGERLVDEIVHSLFLTIFIGKIKERWLPAVKANFNEIVAICSKA